MPRTSLASIVLCGVVMFSIVPESHADSLIDEMAVLNARWDAAINDPNPDALLPMYSSDARLMPPGAPSATGPVAIRDFFAARGKSIREHKLQLVDVLAIGNYAYVTSQFTALLVKDSGEMTRLSGSTVKLYEHQTDGQWKIKSHIFVRE
jgi:ketosteroid isomerase-like protein